MKANRFVCDFLEKNGFEKMAKDKYKNTKCKVIINDSHYEVVFYSEAFLEHMSFYTDSLNFPNLLGNLIWHELIDKNFKR